MVATTHQQTQTSRQRVYRAAWVESGNRAYRVGIAVRLWAEKHNIEQKVAFARMVARLKKLGFVGKFPVKDARSGYLHAMEVA